MNKLNLLSKAEMRKVLGGNEVVDPGTCHTGSCATDADCTEKSCPACVDMFARGGSPGFKFCTFEH